MVTERLTDAERQRILVVALQALTRDTQDFALRQVVAKLQGVDTVVIVQRNAPSAAPAQEPSANA